MKIIVTVYKKFLEPMALRAGGLCQVLISLFPMKIRTGPVI
jgi:hypothetical protein